MSFAEFCMKQGIVDQSSIAEVVATAEVLGKKTGRTMRELGLLSPQTLNHALGSYLKIPTIDQISSFASEIKGKVSNKQISGRTIVFETDQVIYILFSEFCDELIEALEKKNKQIELRIINRDQWLYLVKSFFAESKVVEIQNQVRSDQFAYKKLFLEVLSAAKERSASDIHFEPDQKGLRIRFRIIGELVEYRFIGSNHSEAFLNEAKNSSGLPLVVSGKSADGEQKFEDLQIKVRSSKLPSKNGDGLCLRLIPLGHVEQLKLDSMGIEDQQIETLKEALNFKNGVILISGETGSGKSSTVYSMLTSLDTEKIKIITLEDPIEYESDEFLQLKIDKEKMDFNQGLRSVLRHDPDVILVGEIRDEETAEICFKAAATGHLVISTIHTNDVFGIVSRLRLLGVPEDILGENLRLVATQTLAKKLCVHCCIKDGKTKKRNSQGCQDENCIDGYSNRRQLLLQVLDRKGIGKFLEDGIREGIPSMGEIAQAYVKKGVLAHEDCLQYI